MKRFFLIIAPVAALFLFAAIFLFANVPTPAIAATTFENPIESKDLAGLIKSIVDQLFPFAITITALGIMYYGFLYVVYSGTQNQAGLTKLKGLALPLLIGAAIVAGSKVIVEAVKLFAEGFGGK